MESREALGVSPAPRPPSSQPAAPPPGMMMMGQGHHHHYPSFATHTTNAAPLMISPQSSSMIPNSAFPFNSTISPPHSHSSQQQSVPSSKLPDSLNSPPTFDGSSSPVLRPSGFSIESSSSRKKRGRPRKYAPDGNIALALAPAPNSSAEHRDSDGMTSGEPLLKKHRGRPPGSSGKKQLNAFGITGAGFTPHVILVNAGEDIASKIMDFLQQGPRAVCVLSANGAICNVALRQQAMSGGTVSYEGRFEIVSLSGSFLLSESNGSRSRSGGLSVSLAGSDGRVLGGVVAGMLLAASPVQVIVGSFTTERKRSNTTLSKPPGPAPVSEPPPPPQMLNPMAQGQVSAAATSPPSQGAMSESSDENNGSPTPDHGPGGYHSATAPQSIHGMPMYSSMGWANSVKMLPN